ncbi:MAG: hypothetical protein LKJ06_07920 [Schleiferilactobacillus harbinensis]|jgi:hypothetical protein|nr:hypothetical protein [Schleiferilactobacillus harbinensis]
MKSKPKVLNALSDKRSLASLMILIAVVSDLLHGGTAAHTTLLLVGYAIFFVLADIDDQVRKH